MPKHDKGINVVDDVLFVSSVAELTTPLPVVKKNLLRAGLFPCCLEIFYHCASQTNGCMWIKKGI